MANDSVRDTDIMASCVKIGGEVLFTPGASLILDGDIRAGTIHALGGLVAKWAFGPLGWLLVAANSYSTSVNKKSLGSQIKDRGSKGQAASKSGLKVTRAMLERKYSWTATGGDDPKALAIDRRLLSRKEGYEVIPMIQQVVDHFGYTDVADVHRIENAIGEDLPGNIRGRKKVFDWLVEHCS